MTKYQRQRAALVKMRRVAEEIREKNKQVNKSNK